MASNLVIICRDQDAIAVDILLQEYGAFQTRLSATAWYLNHDASPETLQDELLERLGKHATLYIFEARSVTYNTVDANAAEILRSLFA